MSGERLFALLDREAPWLEQDRIERHFVGAPLGFLHFADDRRIVIRERDAVAVPERGERFAVPGKATPSTPYFSCSSLL